MTLAKSTLSSGKREVSKPAKPRPDFPLFAHASGQWAKKINGRMVYFGPWSNDPKGENAEAEYTRTQVYPDAPVATDRLTVRDLCNQFLTAKKRRQDNGEIGSRTFEDYKLTTDRLVRVLGKRQVVEELTPRHFEKLRNDIAGRSPVTVGNEIQRCRSVFRYALRNRLIDREPHYGDSFDRPSRSQIRKHRQRKGQQDLSADECRALIDAASPQVKAMVLLGLNAGLGNTDIGTLKQSEINLKVGWVRQARQKTGIERRCPLWPETIDALKAIHSGDSSDLVFITRNGRPFVYRNENDTQIDNVSRAFGKLLAKVGIDRQGVNFYALRRTHRTAADGAGDLRAAAVIMGHTVDDISSLYVQRVDDNRLRAVVNHIRAWLFGAS